MKRLMINYRVIFFVILIGDLVSVAAQNKTAEYVFKPLIVIWLLAWFIMQARMFRSPLKKWIILGLLFSWAGDVLLMFQDDYPVFFLLGLSSFLVAHLFYILFFHFVRIKEGVKGRWFLLLI
ncbi:MAG TPA: lysoplasmalogenase family protein, partial [Chitinophagaceae bacterium]|nr:lysoplasmalogenase family protein [Chitinophagaceae bacterium]